MDNQDCYNNTFLDVDKMYLETALKNVATSNKNKIAVKTLEEEISYGKLYEEALELAKKFAFQNQPIAIIGYRNIRTIVQIYAVLLSQNYYVPIDPEYPVDRRNYIISKSSARILLNGDDIKEIRTDSIPIPFENKISSSDRVADIIFTSGSTGKPKGVIETHHQVWNTLIDLKIRLKLTSSDCFLGLASFSFDLSVFDIFASSMVGGTLFIVKDQRDSQEITQILSNYHITIWNSVPNVLNYYLQDNNLRHLPIDNLKVCLLSGDHVSKELVEDVQNKFLNCRVFSLGGATECSIWSILYEVTADNIKNIDYVPYGYPMANQQIYILDNANNVIKNHTIGQIAIGGSGVSLGYVNDTEKTNMSFIEHPDLGYLYLTGDLGEFYYPDYIKFIGRKESQIKVNGYRVSFNEISRVFKNNFNKDCVSFSIKDDEGTDKIILIYFNDQLIEEKTIRDVLNTSLAKYECPHYIFKNTSIPLTQNGKVDLDFLKQYAVKSILMIHESRSTNIEPDTPLMMMLKEVLKVKNISLDSQIFSLGIDSLKMVRIKNWVRDNLGKEIDLVDIYNCDTILDLKNLLL